MDQFMGQLLAGVMRPVHWTAWHLAAAFAVWLVVFWLVKGMLVAMGTRPGKAAGIAKAVAGLAELPVLYHAIAAYEYVVPAG